MTQRRCHKELKLVPKLKKSFRIHENCYGSWSKTTIYKSSSCIKSIQKRNGIQEVIIHTGQHYDNNMSDIFFDEMQIPKPVYNLEVKENLHGAMTGKMLHGIEEVLINEKPTIVLVYGDTNSTLLHHSRHLNCKYQLHMLKQDSKL